MLIKNRSDRIILNNISWQQFEGLLTNLGESRAARIAYDDGILEIMTPLPEQEYYKETISMVIKDIAEVLEIDYESLGSTTWKKPVNLVGIEADNCFYFANEYKIRGKLDFDLEKDPPPDLALEIDVTSKSLSRFPIYARLGVPEIWCYDSGELKIFILENNRYIERENSRIFDHIPIKELPNLIENNRVLGKRAMRKIIRDWVKTRLTLINNYD